MLAIETCVNVLLSWKKLNRFRPTIYREQSRFSGTLPKRSCFLILNLSSDLLLQLFKNKRALKNVIQ
jgi:hypothetical protein